MTSFIGTKQWALVEIRYARQVMLIAGQVSLNSIDRQLFVAIEVPAIDDLPAFCTHYNLTAVQSFTALDEAEGKHWVERVRSEVGGLFTRLPE